MDRSKRNRDSRRALIAFVVSIAVLIVVAIAGSRIAEQGYRNTQNGIATRETQALTQAAVTMESQSP